MKVHFDQQTEAIYFRLDDPKTTDSEEVEPGVILDFNEQNQVVGIEIFNAGTRIPEASLKQIHFEVA